MSLHYNHASMIANLATAVPAPSEIVGLQPSEK